MVKDFALKYFNELKSVLDAINLEDLDKVVDCILDAYNKEHQIFIMGNGGSASTASHFVCDFNKGISYLRPRKFKVICLNDNIPLIMAYSNDVSYEDIFVEQLKNYLKSQDLVIGISGSGKSKNVLKAIDYANSNGAVTIGLTGFDGGSLAEKAQLNVTAEVRDMQKAEDAHLVLAHLIMQIIIKKLNEK